MNWDFQLEISRRLRARARAFNNFFRVNHTRSRGVMRAILEIIPLKFGRIRLALSWLLLIFHIWFPHTRPIYPFERTKETIIDFNAFCHGLVYKTRFYTIKWSVSKGLTRMCIRYNSKSRWSLSCFVFHLTMMKFQNANSHNELNGRRPLISNMIASYVVSDAN